MNYQEFIVSKQRTIEPAGFEPGELNPKLFDWQRVAVQWSLRAGKAALFEDCGLGKTCQQLVWAEHVAKQCDGPVILHCPIGVRSQTAREAETFDISVPVVIANVQGDVPSGAAIVLTNYEKLHKFDSSVFCGVVLDESSILKAYTGKTKRQLCDSYKHTPFRLACTATPAPNDFMELGNHCDFLGIMPSNEMLSRWFINDTMKAGGYRLKGHAVDDFWSWVATWAICVSKPSDLGSFDDSRYELPALVRHDHLAVVDWEPNDGQLFPTGSINATNLHKEKRLSNEVRAEIVAGLIADDDKPWIVWCDTDYEADALKKKIEQIESSVVEVRGSHSESLKLDRLDSFSNGEARVIITKPDIAGFGLNWQHCRNVAFVGLSYSYEKYYQAVRRSWRFGQTQPVHVHVIATDTEQQINRTVERKQADHEGMKQSMAEAMRRQQQQHFGQTLTRDRYVATQPIQLPSWIGG
jgi:superfamily II DNA or RNA helicase